MCPAETPPKPDPSHSPDKSPPTPLLPCCVHSPAGERANTHVAPMLLSSPGAPIYELTPSADRRLAARWAGAVSVSWIFATLSEDVPELARGRSVEEASSPRRSAFACSRFYLAVASECAEKCRLAGCLQVSGVRKCTAYRLPFSLR
jgi:hypothetical protein